MNLQLLGWCADSELVKQNFSAVVYIIIKWHVASAWEAEHHILSACGLQYAGQNSYRVSWDKG